MNAKGTHKNKGRKDCVNSKFWAIEGGWKVSSQMGKGGGYGFWTDLQTLDT
jgi:hypothetical protein